MISVDLIYVVIVLYKTNLEDSLSYISLKASLKKYGAKMNLMVYDNSPSIYTTIKSDEFNIKYIADYKNSGVSIAYNTAFQYALKTKCEYMLLLDQDTNLNIDFVENTVSALDSNSDLIMPLLVDENKNIISPCRYRFGRGAHVNLNQFNEGLNSLHGINFLNSGSLISTELFSRVGGYQLDLPLYFSDFNFFNRAKSFTDIFYLSKNVCVHSLSSDNYDNIEEAERRFKFYALGALKCYTSWLMKFVMFLNVLLRSLKMYFRTKSFVFTKITIKVFFNENPT